MTVSFKNCPTVKQSDAIIATALTGVVYTENGRLHVACNDRHFVYKFSGSPAGWYRRNLKTSDDIYLGEYASPTAELENIEVKEQESWDSIVDENKTEESELSESEE